MKYIYEIMLPVKYFIVVKDMKIQIKTTDEYIKYIEETLVFPCVL